MKERITIMVSLLARRSTLCRFIVVLFAIFIVCPVTLARQPAKQPICNTIQECVEAISQAQVRLQQLTGHASLIVSQVGAVFIRDKSISALGEAYRDPSGLIWGSVATSFLGNVKLMSQNDAEKYCKSIGVRLPTKEEFERLAQYLGKGTANGYSPYTADEKTEILPRLADLYPIDGRISTDGLWSSSVDSGNADFGWAFSGLDGETSGGDGINNAWAVRCVSR